jgi:ribosomal protein L14E/L6E/L27E
MQFTGIMAMEKGTRINMNRRRANRFTVGKPTLSSKDKESTEWNAEEKCNKCVSAGKTKCECTPEAEWAEEETDE